MSSSGRGLQFLPFWNGVGVWSGFTGTAVSPPPAPCPGTHFNLRQEVILGGGMNEDLPLKDYSNKNPVTC